MPSALGNLLRKIPDPSKAGFPRLLLGGLLMQAMRLCPNWGGLRTGSARGSGNPALTGQSPFPCSRAEERAWVGEPKCFGTGWILLVQRRGGLRTREQARRLLRLLSRLHTVLPAERTTILRPVVGEQPQARNGLLPPSGGASNAQLTPGFGPSPWFESST